MHYDIRVCIALDGEEMSFLFHKICDAVCSYSFAYILHSRKIERYPHSNFHCIFNLKISIPTNFSVFLERHPRQFRYTAGKKKKKKRNPILLPFLKN